MEAKFIGKDEYKIVRGKKFNIWISGLEIEIDMGDRRLKIEYDELDNLAKDWEIKLK